MPTMVVNAGSGPLLQEIADVLAKSRKVVVITGAGISTNCGIPDFRSENGLYSLIQAQYDAAAIAKPAESEGDEIDDRPLKRRRIETSDPLPPRMQLRSSKSFSEATTTKETHEGSMTSKKHPIRRTRSFANLSSISTSTTEISLHHQLMKGRTSLPTEISSLEDLSASQESAASSASRRCSLPSSSQSSTAPSRQSLPNLKGKDLFDSIIWSDAFTTSIFYTFVSSLRRKIQQDVKDTTDTHKFIRSLRDAGRLVRNYTQNIDMLETREGLCSELEKGPGNRARFSRGGGGDLVGAGTEVVHLHGSLDSLRCGICSRLSEWDEERHRETLSGSAPDCPHCTAKNDRRAGSGRRSLAIGRLRPDIVLYGEEHPSAHLVGPLITHDLSLSPDILLILGTSLRVHGLKVMIREFAKAVHGKGGKVVFVNQTKPSESVWGDVLDFWVEMDCDAWVGDLKERRPEIWLPQGGLNERSSKEERPRNIAKNPAALRPDTTNGAYLTLKIMTQLGRLSGRLPTTEESLVTTKKESLQPDDDGTRKRKSRPKAIRPHKENGAYLTWEIMSNLRRLSGSVTAMTEDKAPQSLPLKTVSANLPGRRRVSGKRAHGIDSREGQLPTPPNSDQDATPPYTPRTKRTKRLCGISALLSSPISEDTIRVEVYRD